MDRRNFLRLLPLVTTTPNPNLEAKKGEPVWKRPEARELKKDELQILARAKGVGLSGKNLPEFVLRACKMVNVDPERVVWVNNEVVFTQEFPEDSHLLKEEKGRFSLGFVLEAKYPIFLNGVSESIKQRIEAGQRNVIFAKGNLILTAGQLIHEDVHARDSNISEAEPRAVQIAFLEEHKMSLPREWLPVLAQLKHRQQMEMTLESRVGKVMAHQIRSSK